MKNTRPLLSVLIAATVALAHAIAWADSAVNIMTYPNNSAATFDDNGSGNYPVVSAILSAPGTVTGTAGSRTYGNWSYLAQDTTGSLDMFYNTSVVGGQGYTPHVGDSILVQGNYTPFSGIPEIANSTAHPLSVTFGGSGNPLYTPVPVLTTIPTLKVGTNGYALSQSGLGGQLLQLNNVTISGAGANWSGNPGVNVTATITDQSANSMTLYVWGTSYSTCGQIIASGAPVPTGLVNMTGFLSDFYSTASSSIVAEFVPISITEVPEPGAVGFCGLGAALGWVCYRLRKKA